MVWFNENDEAMADDNYIPEGYAGPIISMEEWAKYASRPNVNYKIENGQFIPLNTPEYIKAKEDAEIRIGELKFELTQTDYVVTKISEAQIEDPDEAESLKQRYAETLAQRKEWRAEINRLQVQYGLE